MAHIVVHSLADWDPVMEDSCLQEAHDSLVAPHPVPERTGSPAIVGHSVIEAWASSHARSPHPSPLKIYFQPQLYD